MNKPSLSPKLIVRSPKSMAETAVQFSRLPEIKARNSINDPKRVETTESQTRTKVINFFDIPSPVNEQKLAIVRNALLQRKTLSPNPVLKDEDPENRTAMRKSYQNPKTELELQTEFLKHKNSKKRFELKAVNSSASKDSKEEKDLNDSKDEKDFNDCQSHIKSSENSPEKQEAFNETSAIKKSESMLVFPSFSPGRPSDLLQAGNFETSSLINSLQSEISELRAVNSALTLELFNQQQSFEQLNRNFIDQKQAMTKETSLLMNELSSTKSRIDGLQGELNRLKADKVRLKTELDLSQHIQSDSLTKSEARVYLLNDELQEKSRDYEILKDQLKTSEQNRKKLLEVSKDLELELILTKKQKENHEKDLQELNLKHETLLNEFRVERSKALVVDDLQQEIFQANYEISLIRDENKELVLAKNIAQESLETVQKNFDNSRLAWREKENSYNNTIQDLLEQIQSERAKTQVQAAETAKLRRALTLKDNDFFTNITKDEISRYQQKLMQIDKDYNDSLSEIEKLKRNIDYYRHIVRNKEEVIKKLENHKNSTQDFFTGFKKLVGCEKCEGSGENFLACPCQHLLCQNCRSETCPVCNEIVQTFEVFCGNEKIRKTKEIIDEILKNYEND